MQNVKSSLDELGGVVAVANALGLPVSTVSGWGLSNRVPKWRRDALVMLAKEQGKAPPQFGAEAG